MQHTHPPADETAVPAPAAHSAWRVPHERHVLEATGLTPIVVRPGIVYGGHRGIVGDLLRDGVNGLVRIVGDGRNRWATIYDRDLAELYERLVVAQGAACGPRRRWVCEYHQQRFRA